LDLQKGPLSGLFRTAYFLYKRLFDRGLLRIARVYVVSDSAVLDVGANIGFFSFSVARCSGAHVLAFEPEPRNFEQLEEGIACRGLKGRVHAYRIALSDTTGAAKLYLSDLAPTDHKLIDTRSTSSVEVAAMTLDEFMDRHPEHRTRRISLVKIDVQGAELKVLRGMRKTLELQRRPPIIVECSPVDLLAASVSLADFLGAFAELGYRPYSISGRHPCEPQSLIDSIHSYADVLMLAEDPVDVTRAPASGAKRR